MQKLARIRRKGRDGNVRDAAVNVAHVRYVYSQNSGSYITLEDAHDRESSEVTPIGIQSPDSVEVVIRRLNRPYWTEVGIRVGSLLVAVLAVILTIVFAPR